MSRHARFAELSPEVGEVDVEALEAATAEDPDAVLPLLALMSEATDPALRQRIRALAPRLVLDRARAGSITSTGVGRLHVTRADRGGDLDLDASMGAIAQARAEGRPPGLDELRATAWARPSVALCLLVDQSGSMDGQRLATAAMAAAACALRATERANELAVVAFDRRTQTVVALGEPCTPERVVSAMLRLRGHGMTSVDAALRAAADQLGQARSRRRLTILLSDCRVTDEIDPRPAARALDELVILAPADDSDEAYALAAQVGARAARLEHLHDLPRLLNALIDSMP